MDHPAKLAPTGTARSTATLASPASGQVRWGAISPDEACVGGLFLLDRRRYASMVTRRKVTLDPAKKHHVLPHDSITRDPTTGSIVDYDRMELKPGPRITAVETCPPEVVATHAVGSPCTRFRS